MSKFGQPARITIVLLILLGGAACKGSEIFPISKDDNSDPSDSPKTTLEKLEAVKSYNEKFLSDEIEITEDSSRTIVVYKYDDLAISCSIETEASHGSLGNCQCSDGKCKVTYTPSANYSGEDGFSYIVTIDGEKSEQLQISIDVLSLNDAPTWSNKPNDTYLIEDSTALSVTASATDVDGDSISYSFDLADMSCDDQNWSPPLTINSSTGAISGIVTNIADLTTCSINVKASDGTTSISASFALTLYPDFPGGFTCDSGDALNSCFINTTKNLADGDVIALPGSLIIQNNGELALTNNTETISLRVNGNLTVETGGLINANILLATADNLTVESGATVSANFLGFAGGTPGADGNGPGRGTGDGAGGGGGAYGGNGGKTGLGGSEYGDVSSPSDFGSGGGGGSAYNGGDGGGSIKFQIADSVTVDGTISVDGEQGDGGGINTGAGGSGGSLWIIADTIEGSGVFSAIGASAGSGGDSRTGGSGSGGRIAIEASTFTFSGSISLDTTEPPFGNSVHGYGGDEGSFYTDISSVCDSGTPTTNCIISKNHPLGDGVSISASGSLTIASGGLLRTITQTAGVSFDLDGDFTVNSGGATLANITSLTATNVNILAGGVLSSNGLGYQGGHQADSGDGPGKGVSNGTFSGSGGGHGGSGGDSDVSSGGVANDTDATPSDFGSGGAGGASTGRFGGDGGGRIKITASEKITVSGLISANGYDGIAGGVHTGGGGAGGSIWLIANEVDGAGSITANGGDAGFVGADTRAGGGGGGGMISIDTPTLTFPIGNADVDGGSKGTSNGGAAATDGLVGTICTGGC